MIDRNAQLPVAPHSELDQYLANQFVHARHTQYTQSVDALVETLQRLEPDARFTVVHFNEGVTIENAPKISSYRNTVLRQVSLIVLRNDAPVLDVWDNGVTWDISKYEAQGKRTLLDFSPTNLMRECFGEKVKEFSKSIRAV